MYAVFEDGSRQYRVSEGDVVRIDYREAEIGSTVELNSVVLAGQGEHQNRPTLSGRGQGRRRSLGRTFGQASDSAFPTPQKLSPFAWSHPNTSRCEDQEHRGLIDFELPPLLNDSPVFGPVQDRPNCPSHLSLNLLQWWKSIMEEAEQCPIEIYSSPCSYWLSWDAAIAF